MWIWKSFIKYRLINFVSFSFCVKMNVPPPPPPPPFTQTKYELTCRRFDFELPVFISRTAEVAVELISNKNGSTNVFRYRHEGDEVKDVSIFRHRSLHFDVCGG